MAENDVMAEIEKTTKSQIKKEIEYKDENGKKKKQTITMQRLGGRDRARLQHYMNAGDNIVQYGDLVEDLLEKALVFPHLSFKEVNEDIEKSKLVNQTLEYENYDDEKHKFLFHFTNVKDMLNLLRSARGANESNELEQFFDLATQLNAIKSMNGKKTLTLEDFDDAKSLNEVAVKISLAIGKALNVNGFSGIAAELINFFLKYR